MILNNSLMLREVPFQVLKCGWELFETSIVSYLTIFALLVAF
jgi:hypothetical protein